MQEGSVNILNGTSANGDSLRVLPRIGTDTQTSAFTAVNGDGFKGTEFRVTEAPSSNGAANDSIVVNTQFNSHGWRPSIEGLTEKPSESRQRDVSSSSKRKRADAPNGDADDQVLLEGRESPKRRQLSALVDSAVDLTSPEVESRAAALVQEDSLPDRVSSPSREATPVRRGNQMEQPPKPRPETEAILAQSLLKFQQNQQATESRQSQSAAPDELSPPQDDNQQQEGDQTLDDEMQGDNFDPKKRKRNFSNRTKTGCHTCRHRKKKCDEAKPICSNCERGNFACGGYGPKPAQGFKAQPQNRPQVPLQAKAPPYEPPPGPTGYWQPNDNRQYEPWHRIPPEPELHRPLPEPQNMDPRSANSSTTWSKSTWPPPAYYPPADFPNVLQPPSFAADRQRPTPHPPPHPIDHWATHPVFPPYGHPTGPPPMVHSRDSFTSSSLPHLGLYGKPQYKDDFEQKMKMLRGQSYSHFLDHILIGERAACHNALVRFNKAADKPQEHSQADRARLFTQILEPQLRPAADKNRHDGPPAPKGSVKEHTIVEAPFRCDFGYHVHLGKESVIQPGCYFQDAGGIFVGDRVIVGNNTQLLTVTAANDCRQRGGSQGLFKAGAVRIEDDVYIGSNVVVLPYVTIGKGSVVGAGSVVTRDVEEQTIVAGNPAKKIRRIEGRNSEQHLSEAIQNQESRTIKWMQELAATGFNTSPRIT